MTNNDMLLRVAREARNEIHNALDALAAGEHPGRVKDFVEASQHALTVLLEAIEEPVDASPAAVAARDRIGVPMLVDRAGVPTTVDLGTMSREERDAVIGGLTAEQTINLIELLVALLRSPMSVGMRDMHAMFATLSADEQADYVERAKHFGPSRPDDAHVDLGGEGGTA